MAGRIPARSITGINVEPTAAAQPEADGMAMLITIVTNVQIGTKKNAPSTNRLGEQVHQVLVRNGV